MTDSEVSLLPCNSLLVYHNTSRDHTLYLATVQFTQQLVYLFHCHPLLILMSKIATILILECACLLYASSSNPSFEDALNITHTTYTTSNARNELPIQFPASREYSIPQVTEFILQHRLG